MARELGLTQPLEIQRDSLSKGIKRINDIYLSDPVRIGEIVVGSSIYNTLEVSKTKTAARKAILELNNKLQQVDNELRVMMKQKPLNLFPNLTNTEPRGRRRGARGSNDAKLYLSPLQGEEQASEPIQPATLEYNTDERFRFEDVLAVTGEEGKILSKLSPFDPHHIVSREELMQALSSEDTPTDQQAFDQCLREVKDILDWRRFRLGELPNPKYPDNKDGNGYYVETVRRQQVNITLLGDTVRYRDRQNQTKQIRLSEDQYRILWQLSGGKPKLDKELADRVSDDTNTIVDLLNSKLADLTGVKEIITSLGNARFGNWHKINQDARIVRRTGYYPLRSTRQDALKLIFQDSPDTSKEEIINILGLTSGRIRAPRPLTDPQAARALRNAVLGLRNRTSQSIATEEEVVLYEKMQKYITKHNLSDERDLSVHIANKLGIGREPLSVSDESPADVIDGNGTEDIDYEEIHLPSIETPEFGNLSKRDVALIAESLDFNRDRLEPFLGERGLNLIEESILRKLADLTAGQIIEGLKEVGSEPLAPIVQRYTVNAFERAKTLVKHPDFANILDRIDQQDPNVWSLLVNLSEINDVIEKSGHEEGISLIGKDPESLGTILSELQNQSTITKDKVSRSFTTNEAALRPQVTTVFEAPLGVVEPIAEIKFIEMRPSPLERRDPGIITTINHYLNEILAIPELNGPVGPSMVTRFFPRIKAKIIDQCVKEGWVRGIPSQSNRRTSDQVRFGPSEIATLRYLYENEDRLNARLKKQVQKIAQKEFNKKKDQ